MPAGLWRLTHLERIEIQDRGLSGTIPLEYSMLSFLREFEFSRTAMSGTMPEAVIASLVQPRKLQFNHIAIR